MQVECLINERDVRAGETYWVIEGSIKRDRNGVILGLDVVDDVNDAWFLSANEFEI